MRHNIQLTGVRYRLRPVTVEDAPFIVALRTDPLQNRFLNEISPRIEDQVAWIESYSERSGDYYFIIDEPSSGEAHGAVGLYEMAEDASEALFGRWIIKRRSMAALESAWLVYEAGFSLLGLRSIYTLVLAQNLPVISFHDNFGARRVAQLEGRYTVRGELHDAVEHRITRVEWPAIRARHYSTIARLARVPSSQIREFGRLQSDRPAQNQ